MTRDDIREGTYASDETIHTKEANQLSEQSLDELSIKVNAMEIPLYDMDMNRDKLEKLRAKERYKAALETVMRPYIRHLQEKIETDYDLLEQAKFLLKAYLDRNKEWDNTSGRTKPLELIEQITKNCVNSPNELPEPYGTTIPYTLIKLLDSKEFAFPMERRYTVASYIYKQCKQSSDISLYLNICNVEFYNILLELTWANFYQVEKLKQLVTEMGINGIVGDIYTVGILDKITNEVDLMNGDEDLSNDAQNRTMSTIVWSKDTSMDLMVIQNYLQGLKRFIIG